MAITDRREAKIHKAFFDGRSHYVATRLYDYDATGRVPFDASSLTSIHFRLMQDVTDASLLLNDAMSVDTTNTEDGVANKVEVNTSALSLTAGSEGDALWYLQVVSGGKNFIWGNIFMKCKTFPDGPTS